MQVINCLSDCKSLVPLYWLSYPSLLHCSAVNWGTPAYQWRVMPWLPTQDDNPCPFAFVTPSASTKQPLIQALLGPCAPVGLGDARQTVRTDTLTLIPLSPREEPDLHVQVPIFINCMQVGSRRGGRYQRRFGAFSCLFLCISFLLVVCLAQRCTPVQSAQCSMHTVQGYSKWLSGF